MDFTIVLSSLTSAIIGGLIVAITTHLLSKKREYAKLHADIALKYRVEAWRSLDALTQLPDFDQEEYDKLLKKTETVVSDIVLFAKDQNEMDLIEKWTFSHSKIVKVETRNDESIKNEADCRDILVKTLRKNIREKLNLQKMKTEHFFFRTSKVNSIPKNYAVSYKAGHSARIG